MAHPQRFLCPFAQALVALALLAACAPTAPVGGPAPAAPAPAATPRPGAAPQPAAPALPTAAPAPRPGGPTPSARPTQPSTTPVAKKRGGTLRVAWDYEPADNDPHTTAQLPGLLDVTYNGLIRLDKLQGVIVPELAERWEVGADGKALTFYLRKGVKFQKVAPVNAREVTAEDVIFSYKRMQSPGPQFTRKSYFEGVQSIEAVDKYTVRLTFKEPYAPILSNLSTPWAKVVAKEVVEKCGNLLRTANCAIGTGPFIFKSRTPDVGGYAERNPNYFEQEVPYLNRYEWTVVRDIQTRMAALIAGQIDVGARFDPIQAETMRAKKLVVDEAPYGGVLQVIFHVDKPPFNDIRVRKALNLAIDRPAVIKNALRGGGYFSGPIPRLFIPWAALPEKELLTMPGFGPDREKNLAEARKLLAEAGYAKGLKVGRYVIMAEANVLNRDAGLVIADQWKKLGVESQLVSREQGIYYDSERTGDFDVMTRVILGYVDPDEYASLTLFSKGGRNIYTGYADAKTDELVLKARSTFDEKERGRLYRELEKRVLTETISRFWIAEWATYGAYQPSVKNWTSQYDTVYNQIAYVWLDK